jgi:hypothetical protein
MNSKTLHPLLLVDPEDRDLLDAKWHSDADGRPRKKFCHKFIFLHHLILQRKLHRNLARHEIPDHINGNVFDNRRPNLRVTDAMGNSQNRFHNSEFRGVSWHKTRKEWGAKVGHTENGINKVYWLGWFKDRKEAALAAKRKREELGFLSKESVSQ